MNDILLWFLFWLLGVAFGVFMTTLLSKGEE